MNNLLKLYHDVGLKASESYLRNESESSDYIYKEKEYDIFYVGMMFGSDIFFCTNTY